MKRAAAGGRRFGLLPTQTLALGDAMIAMGEAPEVAARAVNALFNKLKGARSGTKPFHEALDTMNWAADDLVERLGEDAQGTLDAFLKDLAALDSATQTDVLVGLFGQGWADEMGKLLGGLKEYEKAKKLVASESQYKGSIQKEFANRAATTANKAIILGNKISKEVLGFGGGLLPAINKGMDAASAFFDKLGQIRKEFPALTSAVQKVAAGILGAAVAWKAAKFAGKFVGGSAKEMYHAGRGIFSRGGKKGKAGKGGGIAGALAAADAQPVFVTNWPRGFGSGYGDDGRDLGGEGRDKRKSKKGSKAKGSRVSRAARRGRGFAGRAVARVRNLAGSAGRGLRKILPSAGKILAAGGGLVAGALSSTVQEAAAKIPALIEKPAAAAAPKMAAMAAAQTAAVSNVKPALPKPAPAKVLPFKPRPMVEKIPQPGPRPAAGMPNKPATFRPVGPLNTGPKPGLKPAAKPGRFPAAPAARGVRGPAARALARVKPARKIAAKAASIVAAKAAAKAATKAATKAAVKTGIKAGLKTAAKSIAKKIPGLSLLAGGIFAVQRAFAGDLVGAGMEVFERPSQHRLAGGRPGGQPGDRFPAGGP